jgi:hypothetical protein
VGKSFSEWNVEVVSVLGECLVLQLIENGCCSFKFVVACEGVVRTV